MPLFHRNSFNSSSSSTGSYDEPEHHSKFFGHRSSNSSASSNNSRKGSVNRHRFLSRNHDDPSISAAKDQVFRAEAAEKEADKALVASRRAVHEARDHVKRLEREAAEEARLAKIKQSQAKSISKRAKPLGRKYDSSLCPIPITNQYSQGHDRHY
ncbi:hypothetical protein ASPZODRAFT_1530025 [Penicilliopsis zonata CBS 506.65]|uniref:Uncharacterized protein n=1 Tax=Penicilliopsis zonata CBS 506.65 TaxID=1073090 RepID=A0A1L9SLZ2_9EURO|nr:hypothetical protein ASPZODRAFT_1530025 [Penicilliopsis zonata CBS 506.65]OJJ48153.1 hypothetical protein ASPZODRAFT_1530025 [Penicilliopsis zonata CBS 506.65]